MTVNVFISGFVQGVRYRKFVEKTAKRLGLTGWVRNLPDTRVEALLVGEKEVIEKAVGEFWKGSYLSEVKNIDIEWLDKGEEYKDFMILR